MPLNGPVTVSTVKIELTFVQGLMLTFNENHTITAMDTAQPSDMFARFNLRVQMSKPVEEGYDFDYVPAFAGFDELIA